MLDDASTRFITVFAGAVGLAVALVAWLLSRAIAAVPSEDRQYKDQPPFGLRLVWWPIQWCAFFLAPWVSQRRHDALLKRLRQVGLEYSISPTQFIASRLVLGALVGAAFYWVVGSFDGARAGAAPLASGLYAQAALAGFLAGYGYLGLWLRDRLAVRRSELLKTLPFFLDIVTLCVEAGLNLQGAMNQAVAKGPPGVMHDELQRVLRDIRAGKGRAESLRAMADRLNEPTISNFVSSVIQAESMGMNLGPVLRAQADQRRSERFLRAEKLAMEAPVKMLFPLIAFIFPCTFIVLFFPLVMKFMHAGL